MAGRGDKSDEDVVGADGMGEALAGGNRQGLVGPPADLHLPVGITGRHLRHHVGAEHIEHVVVLGVAPVAQGSEAFHETQLVEAGHPVLGGVVMAEEHQMDLAGGEDSMPTKKTKDLSISVGQRGRHVEDQPIGHPPGRRPWREDHPAVTHHPP